MKKEKEKIHGLELLQRTITKDGKCYHCGVAKDKNGYFATTHRARSTSYPNKKDIPHKVLKFISSTG